jgi:TDG/mug DNA glycosylase family protein
VLGGAWSDTGLLGLPADLLPSALGELHRVLAPGAPADLRLVDMGGDSSGRPFVDGTLAALLVGAGFDVVAAQHLGDSVRVRVEKAPTLPDSVAPHLRLLIVGLNPSPAAAATGVPYAGPANRFWPAAIAAGLVDRPHDLRHALDHHGIGFTDLVKRVTGSADELEPEEYRRGVARIERLACWAQPSLICLVGLAGWRAAVDRHAQPGLTDRRLGGRPCYLMPSTSGLNARVRLSELVDHLATAARLADRVRQEPVASPS